MASCSPVKPQVEYWRERSMNPSVYSGREPRSMRSLMNVRLAWLMREAVPVDWRSRPRKAGKPPSDVRASRGRFRVTTPRLPILVEPAPKVLL